MKLFYTTAILVFMISCKKTQSINATLTAPLTSSEPYYYPPLTGTGWETKTATSLGWDELLLQQAFDFAASKNTFGLILLHHGKIVKEQYWNNWTKDTKYPLNSAGKSIVGF